MLRTAAIHAEAAQLGFNLVGVIPAATSPHLAAYLRWIGAGMHGEMGYMARPDRVARRQDLAQILPGVRSLIIVGLDYQTLRLPENVTNDPTRGRIAAYAWGADYHTVMTPRLMQFADWLRAQSPDPVAAKVYVDTGAILERSHAQQAGLGFIGKNTMLIHPRRGSNFFIGEILTDLAFDEDEYDQPARETMCGGCTRCLHACPTDAFPTPYQLDARRCISYLTIEHRGSIAPELRPQMGNWVYGCDVCQAVCPWNRFAIQTQETAFYPISIDRAAPPLETLLTLDDAGFAQLFAGSAILRIRRDRMVRNACIAAGNSGKREFLDLLRPLAAADQVEVVREAATWALSRIDVPR
jgi:epoxyqueuosine reductase